MFNHLEKLKKTIKIKTINEDYRNRFIQKLGIFGQKKQF